MKMKFEIKPHIGANNIEFGMTRDVVRQLLGHPFYSKEKTVFKFQDISIPESAKDGYFENELQIFFDDNHRVEFIEFSGRHSKYIEVFLDGIEIF